MEVDSKPICYSLSIIYTVSMIDSIDLILRGKFIELTQFIEGSPIRFYVARLLIILWWITMIKNNIFITLKQFMNMLLKFDDCT